MRWYKHRRGHAGPTRSRSCKRCIVRQHSYQCLMTHRRVDALSEAGIKLFVRILGRSASEGKTIHPDQPLSCREIMKRRDTVIRHAPGRMTA